MGLRTARDFAQEMIRTRFEFSPPVRSLIDRDFYKDTTGQVIHKHHPYETVTFQLIVRSKGVNIAEVIPEHELRRCLDHVLSLRMRLTDIFYMRGVNLYQNDMFGAPYREFLAGMRLPQYNLAYQDGKLCLSFTGPWSSVTHWETIALAVISELYYRQVLKGLSEDELTAIYQKAMDKLKRKFELIRQNPGILIADFSHRRRHSFLWQKWAIKTAVEMLGKQFVGTSDTYLAFAHDLVPIGTNPHEWPMVLTALQDHEDDKRDAQYRALEYWQGTYDQALRVFLPDTYGSEQFFANAPSWLSSWKGQRQDSGEPIGEGERYMKWLESHGEDPSKHLTIFSDGLDVEEMIRIHSHFGGSHPHSYGWGTLLGNDFRDCSSLPLLAPISMVCKVVAVNGRPVVKLSNNINKATGPRDEVERYVKIFGNGSRTSSSVVV